MYQKSVLDNGVRVITERVTLSRTVAVGIWVDVGSRDEHDLNNGCGHFVEHMLFKGTAHRTPWQIARELDVLGGMSNAFTSRENTCYYATVLDSHLERMVELLADMFHNSLFDPEEVVRERQVILQEISMAEDMPDDQIHDLFAAQLYGRHPLGKTVLGSREVVAAMDVQKLREHVSAYYTADRVVIAAAGNIDHDAFAVLCRKNFEKLPKASSTMPGRRVPVAVPMTRRVYSKPLEQVHAVLGTYALSAVDAERCSLILLNIILGGNMSSRLFQEIREKRGLAYSIYSFVESYLDSGYMGIYLGVDRETLNEAIEVINVELRRLMREPVSEQELLDAKDFAKGGLYLSAENMESRMSRNARNEFCFGRQIPYEEVAAEIDRVTVADVKNLASRLFDRDLTAAVLGPLSQNEVQWELLK